MEIKLERTEKVSGEIVYHVSVPGELPKPFFADDTEGPNWRNGESSAFLKAQEYYNMAVEKLSKRGPTTEVVMSVKL